MDFYSKDPKSGIHNFSEAVGTILVLAVAMSIFAFFRLSTNPAVWKIAIWIFFFLALVQLVVEYRTSSKLDFGFEAVFVVVFISVFFGVYRESLFYHPALLWATIFYRPNYMRHGNRRVAFVLSLLILGVVLPATTGIVTDSATVEVFTFLYGLLVFFLWVFCTKLGLRAIDLVKS